MSDTFDDLVFPESISLASFKGTRQRLTTVAQVESGFDQRRQRWAITKRTYDAGMVARPADQWRLIDDFFEIVEGQLTGFLVKDPTDYNVLQAAGLLTLVTGAIYSFQKIITVGTRKAFRAIGKVNSQTLKVFKTNTGVTTLVDPAHYSMSLVGTVCIDGQLTFAPGYVSDGDTFAWSGDFYVPCRFGTDDLDWSTVDRSAGQLLITGPSIPINEDPQDGLLYLPPTP